MFLSRSFILPVGRRRSFAGLQRCLLTATAKPSSNATRDTRLAGRPRFYKHVGVQEVKAPWSYLTEGGSVDTIESPVSAGVDGTQSASGVVGSIGRAEPTTSEHVNLLRQLLSPAPSRTDSQWYGVTLDGRTLKTPAGQVLAVPSIYLAWAIAAEWDAQVKHLKPAQMPLMTLACTALDQTSRQPHVYQQQTLQYLMTDTTCFWADPLEDRDLYEQQEKAWNSLHQFVEDVWSHKPAMAQGIDALLLSRGSARAKQDNSKRQGRRGLPHEEEMVEKAQDFLHSLDAWHLTAMYTVATEAKSFLVALALLHSVDGGLGVQQAIQAARVEEEFQISNWGLVEGGHDYDRLNCSVQLHSAQILVQSLAMGIVEPP